MQKIVDPVLVVIASLLALAAACSDSGTPGNSTTGAAGSGAAPSGGAGATAAAGSGGGAAGGATAGSSAGALGGVSSSAGAGGGTAGGSSSGGGQAGGGQAGGGQAGGGHVAVRSPGCDKMNPVEGSRTIMTGGQSAMFNVNLPDNYDASTPMPLGFGFHGFGNGACGPDQGECRGFAMLPAVTVYMKSLSEGWEQSGVLEQNVEFFEDVLELAKNEYCIDETRIFIAGVSSGGQFIEHLTCRFGDTLWQVTPVSAGVVGSANQNCKGTPPVLVIHGVTDQVGNYGQGVAEMFAARNACSANVPGGLAQAKADMQAARDAEEDKHVCLDWDGCTKNPVRFCISSQITYDGLTHGWPKIGGMLIGEFQATLPK